MEKHSKTFSNERITLHFKSSRFYVAKAHKPETFKSPHFKSYNRLKKKRFWFTIFFKSFKTIKPVVS